jgi:hypothetical protein
MASKIIRRYKKERERIGEYRVRLQNQKKHLLFFNPIHDEEDEDDVKQ